MANNQFTYQVQTTNKTRIIAASAIVIVIIAAVLFFYVTGLNDSVKKDICGAITNQPQRENCYANAAFRSLNISLCDAVKNKETYLNCVQSFISIALQNKTTSTCYKNDICYSAVTAVNETTANKVCEDFKLTKIFELVSEAPDNQNLAIYCASSDTEFCREFNKYRVPPIKKIERCTA